MQCRKLSPSNFHLDGLSSVKKKLNFTRRRRKNCLLTKVRVLRSLTNITKNVVIISHCDLLRTLPTTSSSHLKGSDFHQTFRNLSRLSTFEASPSFFKPLKKSRFDFVIYSSLFRSHSIRKLFNNCSVTTVISEMIIDHSIDSAERCFRNCTIYKVENQLQRFSQILSTHRTA